MWFWEPNIAGLSNIARQGEGEEKKKSLTKNLWNLHVIDSELLKKVSCLQEMGTLWKARQSTASHAECKSLHRFNFHFLTWSEAGISKSTNLYDPIRQVHRWAICWSCKDTETSFYTQRNAPGFSSESWATHKTSNCTTDEKHFMKIRQFLGVIKQMMMNVGNNIYK